eukprot:5724072-Prorocentrum_lima.AAC.1
MTSSLVGSEMCIRDRSMLEGTIPNAKEVEANMVAMDGSLREIHRSMAVSYTHLTLPTICSV